MNTIKINGKEYAINPTIRAMFIFEQIKGEPFGLYTTLDNFLYFYSLLLASNKDCTLKWDEFVDAIDNDSTLVEQISKAISDKRNDVFSVEEGDSEKKS